MSRLTENTLVPISVVVSVLGAVLWLNNAIMDLRSDVRGLQGALRRQWTLEDMRIWEARIKIMNPSLAVPDSVEIIHNRLSQ